jgi:arylsulfatase
VEHPLMNVVMIGLDALRADRLGCYGYRKATSPFIDSLAKNGVLFENHFTPSVPTQPAFTTIYSGAHPLTTRVVSHEGTATPNPGVTWLPLLMRHHKYCTITVDNLVDHKQWFARGWEYYINPRRRGEFPACHVFNQRAIEWLEKTRRDPFFLAMHYWDTHTPYQPLKPEYVNLFYQGDPTVKNKGSLDAFYANPQVERWPAGWLGDILTSYKGTKTGSRVEDLNFITAHYDAEVRTTDDGVRELCESLQKNGLWDDTLLVIFGDHGEELGEHGIFFDHHGLYDSNLHVPMILHWPKGLKGHEGRRVSSMTQHQDICATVLDAIGAPVPTDVVEGRSLLPLARGQQATSHWGHTLMACEGTWQAKWALRTSEYKLIVSREPDLHGKPPVELYDLLEDPGEKRDLAEREPDLTKRLLEQFNQNLIKMMTQRGLEHDLIAPGMLTLGKRFFERQGKPYPPRDPKWKGIAPPVIKYNKPAAPVAATAVKSAAAPAPAKPAAPAAAAAVTKPAAAVQAVAPTVKPAAPTAK